MSAQGVCGEENRVGQGEQDKQQETETVCFDNALEKAVTFADQYTDVGLVGCRILNEDMTLQRSCFQFPSIFNMAIAVGYLNKLFPNSKLWGRERMT